MVQVKTHCQRAAAAATAATAAAEQVNGEATRTVTPAINIYETEAAFHLVADLPGVAPEDLEVSLDKSVLSIGGKAREGDVVFARTLRLSDAIDREGIAAALNDGALEVTLPKAAALKPQKIQIKVG